MCNFNLRNNYVNNHGQWTPVQNYNQKCLNHDRRYAEDADFLFVALEKQSFENQISISTQRGVSNSGNRNVLKSNSVIDVFKTVVGIYLGLRYEFGVQQN